jgi:hypothetical protein
MHYGSLDTLYLCLTTALYIKCSISFRIRRTVVDPGQQKYRFNRRSDSQKVIQMNVLDQF